MSTRAPRVEGRTRLGLPSTTEVGRRLPKEALYRILKLSPRQKDAFVHGVERIVILNSLKESTIHIPAGSEVEEIAVVGIELRDEDAAQTVVDEIAKANKQKLVFYAPSHPDGRPSPSGCKVRSSGHGHSPTSSP